MKASHVLHDEHKDDDLAVQIKILEKAKFLPAAFWHGQAPGTWRQSRIMGSVDQVDDWQDEAGRPSPSANANTIGRRKAEKVIRVLHNALAHGNIIYLDKDDREIAGRRMVSMAFLSRYEETDEQRRQAMTYRVVVTLEEDLLGFVKAWARWISSFPLGHAVSEAA